MKRFLAYILSIIALLCSALSIASFSSNPFMQFIVGVNDDSVLVNKKITRAGLPIYRAYSFNIIQEAGYYRLAGGVSNQITIAASNVQLNLGGNTVTGGITINSNLKNITINNGTVIGSGATAITVSSGCSSIRILDVSVQGSGATGGISMTQTFDSTVRNCEMIQNTTGIVLNSCSNITVQNCIATRNLFEGFSLLSSNTCTISACKAISTGSDNTFVTLTTVIGFASSGGVGNVFDKCIANSTQALTTTDSNSVIAGFALMAGETGSRITNCIASDTMTSAFGYAIPYGILLQATAATVLTPTGTPPVPIPAGTFTAGGAVQTACDWTSDGRYFAFTTSGAPYLFVYALNKKNMIMNFVATSNVPLTGTLNNIQWSPDNLYLACSSTSSDPSASLRIYRFDPLNNSLILVVANTVLGGNSVPGLSWSPNGRYIAQGSPSANPKVQVFLFDPIVQSVTPVASSNPTTNGATFFCKFSPDGNYIAAYSGGGTLSMLAFNSSAQLLVQVATLTFNGVGSGVVDQVVWSPNGIYIACATSPLGIYQFNRVTNALTLVASAASGNGASSWTPDGKYLIGCNGSVNSLFFDINNQALVLQASVSTSAFSGRLTGDGEIIAVTDSTSNKITLYSPFSFPSKNVIMNNTVYCSSGNSTNTQSGVGICGSSTSNLIIQNTVYSNPVNPPVAPINYAYVTNVFNSQFQDAPTLMQNIALGSCDPIPLRRDQPQSWDILLSKLVDISTKVDLIIP